MKTIEFVVTDGVDFKDVKGQTFETVIDFKYARTISNTKNDNLPRETVGDKWFVLEADGKVYLLAAKNYSRRDDKPSKKLYAEDFTVIRLEDRGRRACR